MSQKKSKDYWEKRARENENKVYKQGTELVKKLNSSYIRARREIQKSINDLVARYMDKTELSYAEAMKYLTNSEFKEWRMTLKDYEEHIEMLEDISPELAKKIKIELETLAMKSRITRLDSLKTQIDFELNKKTTVEQDLIEKGVSAVYTDFYKMQATEFGLTGVNTILPKKTIERLIQQPWSGANFSERIWGNTEALGKVLKQEIIQSFMQGISVKDLSDRIQKRFDADRYNTERLVRTELNYALNETTKLSYEEAEIEEYEYLAEIDSRTSDICRELNGQKFKMKDAKVGVNYPPMHPHCRSTAIPVIDYENFGKKKDKIKNKQENKKDIQLKNSDIIEEKDLSKLSKEKINAQIKDAKTVTEINDLCEGYFNNIQSKIKRVNFEGCDLEAAKENAMKLIDLDSRFESGLIDITMSRLGSNVAGDCTPTKESAFKYVKSKGQIKFESKMRLNVEILNSRKLIEKEYESVAVSNGMYSLCAPIDKKNAAISTLVHEYGHSILPGKLNELLVKVDASNPDYTTMIKYFEKYINELAKLEKNMNEAVFAFAGKENGLELGWKKAEEYRKEYNETIISKYSKSSPGEFIAEAFCDAELSSKPKKWSIKVHDYIVKHFGK